MGDRHADAVAETPAGAEGSRGPAQPPLGTSPAHALTSDVQPPEPRTTNSCCCEPLSLGRFVTAATGSDKQLQLRMKRSLLRKAAAGAQTLSSPGCSQDKHAS